MKWLGIMLTVKEGGSLGCPSHKLSRTQPLLLTCTFLFPHLEWCHLGDAGDMERRRREVGKERESRMEEEDKMEKRGKCWTSRLGEALREEKGEGASEYLQPTFHLAPDTQWRKGNLSLS